jgi:hypothetical protein
MTLNPESGCIRPPHTLVTTTEGRSQAITRLLGFFHLPSTINSQGWGEEVHPPNASRR